MRTQDSEQFSYNEIKKLLNKMFNMYDILTSADYKIEIFRNTFCPFHDNEDTPSAKYYPSTDTLYCFSEGKVFSVIDAFKLVGRDYLKEFYEKWDTYSKEKKDSLLSNIEESIVEDKIVFKDALNDFKNGLCSYTDLCREIAKSAVNSIDLMKDLYSVSNAVTEVTVGSNDYFYLAWKCGLKNIRELSLKDVIKSGVKFPSYVIKFLESNVNCIAIFNMCGKIPVSCVIRGIDKKEFINIGNTTLFYGICNLKHNFKYGDRITLVEGSKDCEVYRNIFNDKNCLAINTAVIRREKVQLLKYLTNDIVLAQDNDLAGVKARERFKRYYSKSFKINDLYHVNDIKDFGDLIPLLRMDYDKAANLIKRYRIHISNFI